MPPTSAESDTARERQFERLMRDKDRVLAFARRLLGDANAAEDAAQDAYLAAWQALPEFRGEARLSTWFHRVVVRVLCRSRRRSARRAEREVADDAVEHRLSAVAQHRLQQRPLDELDAAERRARVLDAIDRLSPPLREVLLLRGEGMAYAEIADTLGIPLGTVRSRIAAATVQLADRLSRHAEEAS